MDEDQLELLPMSDSSIVQEIVTREYLLNIDQPIEESSSFREVFMVLRNATERDTIRVIINTPGGYVSTATQLCNYLLNTKAKTIAEVQEACSAGSVIAMHCDKIETNLFSFMMIHSLNSGISGKASDIKNYTDFIDDWNDDLIRNSYLGFLSNDEIKSVLGGTEIWLNKKKIDARLKQWVPVRERKVKK